MENKNTKIKDLELTTELDEYQDCHRYANQKHWESGFPINPVLRKYFDMTPNDEREPDELEDWWGKPFILTHTFSLPDASYSDYVSRMTGYGYGDDELESEEVYNQDISERRERWSKKYPSGLCYEVRCLDGGAWDRSTSKGEFSKLELAVLTCKKIKAA